IEAAWEVLCYADESVRFIFEQRTGSALADRLFDHVRRLPEGMGLDRTQQRDLFGRHAGKDLEAARELLEAQGLVENVKIGTGGRARVVTFPKCDVSDRSDLGINTRSLRSLRSQTSAAE